MDYALLIYADEAAIADATPEQMQGHVEAFGSYMRDLGAQGVLQGGDPLLPTESATTIKLGDGSVVPMDGPYADTKEQLAGFFLITCPDLDAAIGYASRIPAAPWSSIEIRPVNEALREAVHGPGA